MKKAEVWELFSKIVWFYPSFSGDDDKVDAWYEILRDVPFETALLNLKQHAAVEERWPPAVARLARSGEADDSVKYHEGLKQEAQAHISEMAAQWSRVENPSSDETARILAAQRKARDILATR